MHTVFHFFHSALLVLVFLVRGRLLWLHSSGQEINVGLLVHLSSARPCVQKRAHRRHPSSTVTFRRTSRGTCSDSPVAPRPAAGRWASARGVAAEALSDLSPWGSFLALADREKLWFHGVDYFSLQSLKDKAQGRRDCSPFMGSTKGLLS